MNQSTLEALAADLRRRLDPILPPRHVDAVVLAIGVPLILLDMASHPATWLILEP